MRKNFKYLLLCCNCLPVIAAAQFSDDFSDGDFTNNPAWNGDTAKFEIVIAPNMLHLNAPTISDVAYLSTPSQSINNAVWEFLVRMDFNPSSSNYAKVYLVSDRDSLNTALNAYFVKVGNTTDEVSLYRQDGATDTEIIDGTDDRLNMANVVVRIKVTRDAVGNWELFSDSTGATNYVSEGTVLDDTYIQSNYFGLHCTYTSTRSTWFYYDDFIVSGDPYIDSIAPTITELTVISANKLDVQFSEFLDKSSAETPGNYSVNNSIGAPLLASRDGADSSLVHLTFSNSLNNALWNTLTVTKVEDLSGNAISSETADFVLPEQGLPGDVLINEVLFNPPTYGQDFIEIYNHSRKIINLKDWKLANFEQDTIANFNTIISTPLMMMPGEFIVITKDSANIKKEYPLAKAGTFLEISTQPNYNNDSSTVFLINSQNSVVDKFSYTDEMHFALLNDAEGISLERMDYDHPTNDATNWHSAAESVGFATPGYENSQYNPSDASTKDITIDPEIFSPDNDGFNDVVRINYKFDEPGFVANVTIYDAKGRLVKYLVKNELLAMEGTFSWDGINELNEKARIGIYIIYFEAFNLEGEVKKFKKTCVLATRL